jgi:hypothetical protein
MLSIFRKLCILGSPIIIQKVILNIIIKDINMISK